MHSNACRGDLHWWSGRRSHKWFPITNDRCINFVNLYFFLASRGKNSNSYHVDNKQYSGHWIKNSEWANSCTPTTTNITTAATTNVQLCQFSVPSVWYSCCHQCFHSSFIIVISAAATATTSAGSDLSPGSGHFFVFLFSHLCSNFN